MKKLIILLLVLIPLLNNYAQTLEDGIDKLSKRILIELNESNKTRIAIIEFSNLDGKKSDFGKYLSEELITRIFIAKKFQVIERQMLAKILDEYKLNSTGLIDEKTANKIGEISGAEVICTGTFTDLGNSIKINARLISTESGSLLSVASSEIQKDDVVKKLMGQVSYISSPSGINKVPGKVIYYENFSNIKEGQAPPAWLGTEHVMVKTGRQNILTSFENGKSKLRIPNVNFTDDWKIEFYFKARSFNLYIDKIHAAVLSETDMLFGGTTWSAGINNSFEKISADENKLVIFSLEKKGTVLRLFIDGLPIIITRIYEYEKPDYFTIDFASGRFQLYRINLTEL